MGEAAKAEQRLPTCGQLPATPLLGWGLSSGPLTPRPVQLPGSQFFPLSLESCRSARVRALCCWRGPEQRCNFPSLSCVPRAGGGRERGSTPAEGRCHGCGPLRWQSFGTRCLAVVCFSLQLHLDLTFRRAAGLCQSCLYLWAAVRPAAAGLSAGRSGSVASSSVGDGQAVGVTAVTLSGAAEGLFAPCSCRGLSDPV